MGRQFDDATRRFEDSAERTGRQAGDATERAGQEAADATERVGSEIEDTAHDVGTQLRSARSGLPYNDTEVDVADRADEFVVRVDLPGFSKDDIDATLSGQTLRIVAENEESTEENDESYLRRERRQSSVRRSVALPADVVGDDATASYQNGVLAVTVPKAGGDNGQSLDIN